MKILLTGHRGFIGQNLLQALEAANHEVSVFEWGDNLPSILEQDWVLHIGAISSTTERDIEKIMKQNYDFSCMVFDACKTYGVNLQYSSSASVYGMGTDFSETAQPDPRNAYAWSKYLFERYHQQHQGGNITQGFRYFNVYGPGETHKGSQASPHTQFAKQACETGFVKVFENSDQYIRDFVPVKQVVATHLAFLNSQESGVFNIGTGKPKSFLQVAQQFDVPVIEIPMPEQLKASYQKYTCADMTKTNRVYDHFKTTNPY
jgi:ADP-L-glycero-D-manno-heptose 6-epimerase